MNKENKRDISIFFLRVTLGTIFFAHGAQKLFGMFGGIGIEGTTRMMEGLGFSPPESSAVVWSCIEFFGGIFLSFGVLARYAALLISVVMVISIWKINASYGFFIQNGGYEYNLLIIASCLPVILLGGGKWSLWDL
jgi:putative oxidoreductase